MVDPSFLEVNTIFVLSIQNNAHRATHTGHFFWKVETKDYNVMIDVENFFDQPVKDDLRIYGNVQKIAIGQEDNYAAESLLNYPYFNENYKLIAIDLSKQQALEADPRAIQQINFTKILEREGNTNTTMYFIIEETILYSSQQTVKLL